MWKHRIRRSVAAMIAGLAFAALACDSEIGGSCDEAGSTDECVDGGICTNESGFFATCRVICFDQSQCAPGFQCNGVTNTTLKSCQPG